MAIQVSLDPKYMLLKSDRSVLTEEEAKNCIEAIKAQTESREVVVFDFSAIQNMTLAGVRMLTRAISPIAQTEAKVAIVTTKEVSRFLHAQGLDRIFPCYTSLQEVFAPQVKEQKKPQNQVVEFLNTILDSVVYTFQVSTSTKVVSEPGYVRKAGNTPKVSVGASLGLISHAFMGNLSIMFPKETFLKTMSQMMGQEYKDLVPEIKDGAAEILNICLGQAKTILNEKGYGVKQAIPVSVSGENLDFSPPDATTSIIVPFKSDLGPFYIEFATSNTNTPAK